MNEYIVVTTHFLTADNAMVFARCKESFRNLLIREGSKRIYNEPQKIQKKTKEDWRIPCAFAS